MSRSVHNSAVELASPLFRRKRKRGNTGTRSSAGLKSFSIVGRRYSAGLSRRFSPFFSDRFERRGLVYVGADINNPAQTQATNGSGYWQSHGCVPAQGSGRGYTSENARFEDTHFQSGTDLVGADWAPTLSASETNEKNAIRAYEYDDLGRLIQTTDRNGRVIQYEYDYLGRQTAEKWLDSNNAVIGSIEYTFDGNNNLLTVTDSISGTDYEYRYDALNRCVYTKVDSDELNSPVEFTYAYNSSDLTVTETLTGLINGVVAPYYQNVYQYDVFGRLESISQTGTGLTAKSVDYVYNLNLQRISAEYQQNGAAVSESAWVYDVAGKVSSIQHKTALDAVFAEYDFTWDAGNRITEFETVDGTAEYTYDKTGQLTGADYDYITDELYTYDDNGNRTNSGYVTGENNETLSDGMYRYSYDAEGNRIEKFLWTDSNNDGVIDASEKALVQTYNWDYRNRLESVTNYENGIAKEIINYLYDYLNLMIERTITDAATSALQSSEYNLYSNGQIVLEYDTTSSVDVVKSINLWGANIDELVAVEQMAQSVNDNNDILWTYGDHLNSIRDVLTYDSITQTAAVVNHLIYNAFGILVSSTDGNSNNPTSISPLLKYRYTGKYYDDLTGLQNNINRWYDNTAGKWISVDPIGFKGGDVNLYRYAGGSLKRDINGLFTMEDFETVYQMSRDEFLSIFCSVHKNDPDLEKMIAFYKYEIYPRNEVRNQIDEKLKSLSENLYYSIINGIKEKERLRSRFQQLFLNNSFNESSNIVNSPYLRNGNTQVGIPSVPYAVNPYGGFGSNYSNHSPDSNSERNAPQSVYDFNKPSKFDPKYDKTTLSVIQTIYRYLSSQEDWMAKGTVDPKNKIDKQLCGIPERLKGYQIDTFYSIPVGRINIFDGSELIIGPTTGNKFGVFVRGNEDFINLNYQFYFTVGIKDLEQAIRNHNLQFEQKIGFEIYKKNWYNFNIYYEQSGQEWKLGTGIILSW